MFCRYFAIWGETDLPIYDTDLPTYDTDLPTYKRSNQSITKYGSLLIQLQDNDTENVLTTSRYHCCIMILLSCNNYYGEDNSLYRG